MNKRLLISESHDDSNQCTPYRGKPDQYVTRFPRSVRVWPSTIHISRGPRIAAFRELPIDLDGFHCSREKGLPTQSTTRWLTDPRIHIQFLSQANQWISRLKPRLCRWKATRLTGPISPIYDRYVQYLLTEANPLVINWHRQGLQPWRFRLTTYHSLNFSTDDLHFSPKDPTRSTIQP
jgi:hypothetical protein